VSKQLGADARDVLDIDACDGQVGKIVDFRKAFGESVDIVEGDAGFRPDGRAAQTNGPAPGGGR
jgi:hypothetical protein